MTDAHKQALAEGRAQERAVRAYLEALDSHRPKRGRKRTPESINRRLTRIDDELASADPMRRLSLVQERIDLHNELAINRGDNQPLGHSAWDPPRRSLTQTNRQRRLHR